MWQVKYLVNPLILETAFQSTMLFWALSMWGACRHLPLPVLDCEQPVESKLLPFGILFTLISTILSFRCRSFPLTILGD